MGRKPEYTEDIAKKICERLIEGESLRAICADDGMPNRATVFRWLDKNEEFHDQYARAREMQADGLFDEILEIADATANDWIEASKAQAETWQVNNEAIQRSRLRIEARKWMASKLKPKKYGDKLELDNNIKAPDPIASLFQQIAGKGKRLAHDDNTLD